MAKIRACFVSRGWVGPPVDADVEGLITRATRSRATRPLISLTMAWSLSAKLAQASNKACADWRRLSPRVPRAGVADRTATAGSAAAGAVPLGGWRGVRCTLALPRRPDRQVGGEWRRRSLAFRGQWF